MGIKPKIDIKKAWEMRRSGATLQKIADRFNCSAQSVSECLKKASYEIVKSHGMHEAGKILDQQQHALIAQQQSMDKALAMVDLLYGFVAGDPKAVKTLQATRKLEKTKFNDPMDCMAKFLLEIRKNLEVQIDIYALFCNTKMQAEFQKEVLDAIGEESLETRQRIIERLRQRKAISSSIELGRKPSKRFIHRS